MKEIDPDFGLDLQFPAHGEDLPIDSVPDALLSQSLDRPTVLTITNFLLRLPHSLISIVLSNHRDRDARFTSTPQKSVPG